MFHPPCQVGQLLVQESYQMENRHTVVYLQRFLQYREHLHAFLASNIVVHQRVVNHFQFSCLLVSHCVHFQQFILVTVPQNRLAINRNKSRAFSLPVALLHRLSFLVDYIQHFYGLFQNFVIFCTSRRFKET